MALLVLQNDSPPVNTFASFLPLLLILALIGFFVWRGYKKPRQDAANKFDSRPASDSRRYCTKCGFVGDETEYISGSGCIEILLYLFFIIPGVIYSLIRRNGAYWGCPECGAHNMVPLDSAAAKQGIAKQTPPSLAVDVRYCTYCGAPVPAASRYCGGCGREKVPA